MLINSSPRSAHAKVTLEELETLPQLWVSRFTGVEHCQ
jgi:hypothetical protein